MPFEKVPKLLHCANRPGFVYYLHAWNNPIGGNWEGMKETMKGKLRRDILWKCYGITEAIVDVVFPQFSRAAHCLPQDRLPRDGTWYQVVDPTDAKRNWAMIWVKISPAQISFVAREWPQEHDNIPGVGRVGPWAITPTGKRFDGDRGPGQEKVIFSFEGYAKEIARVEKEIEELEMELHGKSDIADRSRIIRIMDCHLGNQDTMSHSSSETHIESMLKLKLRFLPSGKDSGAGTGIKTIKQGCEFISDLLDFDAEKAQIDPETDRMNFNGKAPLLRIASNCTNLIWAMENWTGEDGGSGACKDFPDCLRYYAIARPRYREPILTDITEAWGGY